MQAFAFVLVWFGLASSVQAFTAANIPIKKTALKVASVDVPPVSEMQRGVGGRIEEAFAAAKEKGEAAFVTFVTAGYPAAQGEYTIFV